MSKQKTFVTFNRMRGVYVRESEVVGQDRLSGRDRRVVRGVL